MRLKPWLKYTKAFLFYILKGVKIMATLSNITVKKELRLCKVNKELGYFHCWEQYCDVIAPGLTIGSHPGGQYSRVFGIVEFDDRVTRIEPSKIKFVDEAHDFLRAYSEMDARKEKK